MGLLNYSSLCSYTDLVTFSATADPVAASKLRVRGGRNVEYNGDSYRIGALSESSRKGKKYVAEVTNTTSGQTKKVHWGATGYDDYYVHRDKKRRENFQKRHGAIKKKDGTLAASDPFSPAYYATKANWSSSILAANFSSAEYIPLEEWDKIPLKLRKQIRAKEKDLNAIDLKNKKSKSDDELDSLYTKARKYANWSSGVT